MEMLIPSTLDMCSIVLCKTPPFFLNFVITAIGLLAGIFFIMKYYFTLDCYFFPFFLDNVVSENMFVMFFNTVVIKNIIVIFGDYHFAFTIFFCTGKCLSNHALSHLLIFNIQLKILPFKFTCACEWLFVPLWT